MTELDQLCINTIRVLSAEAVQKAESGHPGLPMGAAVMAYALWSRHLKHNPRNPKWPDRDRFVLSAGHGSMLLYSLLHLTGYDVSLDDLRHFRQIHSRTPGHPEYGLTAGVETTTGPLGQGAGNAVGMAIAEAWLAARFNKPGSEIVDHATYTIVSDGDLMEGVASEAASLAGHLKLGKLVFLYDNNHITIDGKTDLSFSENVTKRFEAYGWHTLEVDGENLDAVDAAIKSAKAETSRPSLVNCRTTIGYGSPNKAGTSKVHGAPLGQEELALAKQALGWGSDEAFHIPETALFAFRKAVEVGAIAESNWNDLVAAYSAEHPETAAQFRMAQSGDLPEDFAANLPVWDADPSGIATRAAFGTALNATATRIPWLVGGSADLAESTNTDIHGENDMLADHLGGRIMHFGVREHGMGAILNGMTLHGGIRPFGSTFFVFSDYMRPSIRLAALSEINPIYIFTHDSVGLGEDGPTHQPVEHLAACRAVPNLTLIRPADANETAIAWRIALSHTGGPIALILSRQKLPVFDRVRYSSAEETARGAYVLAGGASAQPEIILISSGSEVQWAIGAFEKLQVEGIQARVVSMPSWELFDAQSTDYQNAVLPPGVTKRLSIEAAATFGWRRWVGDEGDMIGIERFGVSAPLKDVLAFFELSVDHVYARAKALLAR